MKNTFYENWETFIAQERSAESGQEMYQLVKKLWPICRSITGNGIRETLGIIKDFIPNLKLTEIPSGTKCFDWEVPPEWNIRDAWVKDSTGKKIIDFKQNNLHVLNYSMPVHEFVDLDELKKHLYSLPDQPDLIPYVSSYYKRRWGFCLSHRDLERLQPGRYEVCIDSDLSPGSLTYGEFFLPGETEDEIFFSTYVCHPSLANNELSGPAVVTSLVRWLMKKKNRRFSYRFYFGPETIGSIVYLSRNLEHLKKTMWAGFMVNCVGDERCYSFMPSRNEHTLADKVGKFVLQQLVGDFVEYPYLARGSDERQYCSPGADLPVTSLMRSKYGAYPEYHTSADNLNLISEKGLADSLAMFMACIYVLEHNFTWKAVQPCEPQLGKRGLYPSLGTKSQEDELKARMDFLAYCDGTNDVLSITQKINGDFASMAKWAQMLNAQGLIIRT